MTRTRYAILMLVDIAVLALVYVDLPQDNLTERVIALVMISITVLDMLWSMVRRSVVTRMPILFWAGPMAVAGAFAVFVASTTMSTLFIAVSAACMGLLALMPNSQLPAMRWLPSAPSIVLRRHTRI